MTGVQTCALPICLFVVAGMVDSPRVRDSFPERIPDHQILSVVDWLSTKKPKMKTILVTKDVNLRMKARSIGLLCEDSPASWKRIWCGRPVSAGLRCARR